VVVVAGATHISEEQRSGVPKSAGSYLIY